MAQQESTESLLTQAQQGDRRAFDEVAERYRARLLDSVRARLHGAKGSFLDPEDVVDETLLRALERLPSFEWTGEDSFLRWLFGISRNVRLHELRRTRSTLSLAAAHSAEARDPTPSRALRRDERFDRLERAVAGLPPEYREVVRLCRIDGLKTKEVAARLGKSPDSVKHLLARAIALLRGTFDATESLHLPDRRLGGES